MDNVRVVRGPDWKSGNQDGEGLVGTVVEVKAGGATVVVQWDNGNRHEFPCGSGGNFELRVFDNAPAGIKHRNVMCDSSLVPRVTRLVRFVSAAFHIRHTMEV
jgi:E3 ubiquitin-protein ligase mind-bomb